jgi:hypothetical protein
MDDDADVPAALRDAGSILERSVRDEREAVDLRIRYESEPMQPLVADPSVIEMLETGEELFAVREPAILNASDPDQSRSLPGYGGTLYLTSTRLVHRGQVVLSVAVRDIVDTVVVGERLLLMLHGGEGLSVDIDRPRVFRVQLSAIRQAAARP